MIVNAKLGLILRDIRGREGVDFENLFFNLRFKKKKNFWWRDFSLEGDNTLPQNSSNQAFTEPMRTYPAKENYISLAVSESIRYKQTDNHPVTLL